MKVDPAFLPPHEVLQALSDLLCGMSLNGTNPQAVELAWRRPLIALAETASPERLALWATLLQDMRLTAEESKMLMERVQALSPGGSKKGRQPAWLKPQSAGSLAKEAFPVVKCAVNNIIPEGLTLFVSPPKIGKSALMLHLSTAIGHGGRALSEIPVEKGSVLYFSLEDGPRRLQRRMAKMLGDTPAPDNVYFVYQAPSLDSGLVDGLANWLAEHPDTKMVVIDTFARVRPRGQQGESMYQQDYDALSPLQDLAKEWNVAIVVVHHTRKMVSDDVLEMASGTNGLTGVADAVLVLQRGRGELDAVLHVVSKDLDQDLAHAFSFDPLLGTYKLLGDAASVMRSKERKDVIDAINAAGEPQWPRQIADSLGKKDDAVRQLLSKMIASRELIKDHGKYKVAPERPIFGNDGNSDHNGNDDHGDDRGF